MLNDMAWRKTPRDILTNPRIRAICNRTEPRYKQAVIAFYVACYMEADDDGVIDISDTEVLADLIMVEDENLICEFADKFIKKGFFEPLNSDLTLLLFTDWDNPTQAQVVNGHRISETADARRKRINENMKGGKKRRRAPTSEGEVNPAPDSAFLCPENDKNQKSVAQNDLSVTNLQKASCKQRDKREIQEISESKRETHTQEIDATTVFNNGTSEESYPESLDYPEATVTVDGATLAETALSTGQDTVTEPLPTGQTQSSPDIQAEQAAQPISQNAISDLLPDSTARRIHGLNSYDQWRACGIFYNFFAKKGPFPLESSEEQLDALSLLTLKVSDLAELKNPPYVIAGQFVKLFGDLVTQQGVFKDPAFKYFYGMPLTPVMLLKPSVFPRILAEAKKILSPGVTAGKIWSDTFDQYREEVEQERQNNNGSSFIDIECRKMGIDPTKPGAMLEYFTRLKNGAK